MNPVNIMQTKRYDMQTNPIPDPLADPNRDPEADPLSPPSANPVAEISGRSKVIFRPRPGDMSKDLLQLNTFSKAMAA